MAMSLRDGDMPQKHDSEQAILGRETLCLAGD